MAGLLSKERIVAGPRFNRWWNVAAALAINLSIGQAYAFSVFNLPLTRVLGVSEPLPEDWKLSALGWIFTLAYVFLGLSAGVGGKWQDRVGPRLSGVVAAFCFGSGLFLSALGVWRHQLSWLYLGYGVFCFNDTATTEIYTLSLHDALPISRRRDKVRGMVCANVEGSIFPRPARERKSTRLNSSHVEISYAVFCLKKKK